MQFVACGMPRHLSHPESARVTLRVSQSQAEAVAVTAKATAKDSESEPTSFASSCLKSFVAAEVFRAGFVRMLVRCFVARSLSVLRLRSLWNCGEFHMAGQSQGFFRGVSGAFAQGLR